MSIARGPLLRKILAELGGVSSTHHLAEALSTALGEPVDRRQVKNLVRSAPSLVRHLGAGFVALTDAEVLDLHDHVAVFLAERGGTRELDEVVEEVLRTYPHGRRLSVVSWLSQDPGRIQREGDRVRYLGLPRA